MIVLSAWRGVGLSGLAGFPSRGNHLQVSREGKDMTVPTPIQQRIRILVFLVKLVFRFGGGGVLLDSGVLVL